MKSKPYKAKHAGTGQELHLMFTSNIRTDKNENESLHFNHILTHFTTKAHKGNIMKVLSLSKYLWTRVYTYEYVIRENV